MTGKRKVHGSNPASAIGDARKDFNSIQFATMITQVI